MDNFIKQLKDVASETRLSHVEKAAIKSQLLRYVKTHPVNISNAASHAIPSPFSIRSFRNKKTLSAFVVGGILLGSSVSFAAENTLPGDLLYPVKINLNEKVRDALAITPQAKADWAVQKAERRLVEAEKLAVAPSVPTPIKISAEDNFKAATRDAQNAITTLDNNKDSKDAIAATAKLSEMLRNHEDSSVNKEKDPALAGVLENVHAAHGDAEKKQEELKLKYNLKSKDGITPVSLRESSGVDGEFLQKGSTASDEINPSGKDVKGHHEELRGVSEDTLSLPVDSSSRESEGD